MFLLKVRLLEGNFIKTENKEKKTPKRNALKHQISV